MQCRAVQLELFLHELCMRCIAPLRGGTPASAIRTPTWHSVGVNGICAVTAPTRSGNRILIFILVSGVTVSHEMRMTHRPESSGESGHIPA